MMVPAEAGNQVSQTYIILGGKDAQETQTAFPNDVLFHCRDAAAYPQRLRRRRLVVDVKYLGRYPGKGRHVD